MIVPLPHQESGAEWLTDAPRRILGDRPGFGKTHTIGWALQRGFNDPAIVVCPAIARGMWHRMARELDLVLKVFSYENLVNGGFQMMREHLGSKSHRPAVKYEAMVVDEFHYCKHAESERSRIVLGENGWARRFETVYLSSGTPVPRHPGEFATTLMSMFPALALEYGLKTVDDVVARYCVTTKVFRRGAWRPKVVGVQHMDEFRALLSRCMLRREEMAGVPKVFWQTLDISADEPELPPGVRQRLAAGESLEEIAKDPHVARYRRQVGMIKAGVVAQMLYEQLYEEDGMKVVVMAHHRDVLESLRSIFIAAFGVEGVAYIDGDTPQTKREEAEFNFQNDPACRVFLGQNIACHVSITLTASDRVVLVEPDWAAYINDQIGQRVGRIGSPFNQCVAQMVCLSGTLDEAIVAQNLRETKMVAQAYA